MRVAFFSLLWVLWSGLALAQDQPALAVDQATTDDSEKRVLIIGDQLAGGMGAGLARMIQNDETSDLTVINRFNEASGLARPEIYDWAAAIPKITDGKNFSSAVLLLGLNDRRDMRDGDKILKFNTPEWDTLYKTRIDAVLDALTAAHVQVLWMGEPPMGDPGLDADMQNITALIKERTAAKGAIFLDLRTPFLNPAGGYVDRGPDDTGADRRLREGDGVTFMKVGNNRLGQIALAALKTGAAVAPANPTSPAVAQPDIVAPVTPSAPVASAEPPKADEPEGPIFGQEGVDNDTAATNSKEVVAGVENDQAAKQAASQSIIGVVAAKGSNAETLFSKGIFGAAPAGRFDDFSAPAN